MKTNTKTAKSNSPFDRQTAVQKNQTRLASQTVEPGSEVTSLNNGLTLDARSKNSKINQVFNFQDSNENTIKAGHSLLVVKNKDQIVSNQFSIKDPSNYGSVEQQNIEKHFSITKTKIISDVKAQRKKKLKEIIVQNHQVSPQKNDSRESSVEKYVNHTNYNDTGLNRGNMFHDSIEQSSIDKSVINVSFDKNLKMHKTSDTKKNMNGFLQIQQGSSPNLSEVGEENQVNKNQDLRINSNQTQLVNVHDLLNATKSVEKKDIIRGIDEARLSVETLAQKKSMYSSRRQSEGVDKTPDLKEMINRFKLENKMLVGPQAQKKQTRNNLEIQENNSLQSSASKNVEDLNLKQLNTLYKTINLMKRMGQKKEKEFELDDDEKKFLAMKIQGLKDEDEDKNIIDQSAAQAKHHVNERILITEWLIVRHDSPWKIRFDILIILLALWNCISLPLEVSFSGLEYMNTEYYDIFSVMVDTFFAIDILANLRTTFISEKTGTEVVVGKIIIKNYLLSARFMIDLIATIPFELFVQSADGVTENSQETVLLGSLKLFRLFRLGRIIQFMKMRQSLKLGFKIFQMLALLILIMHWIGCVLFKFVQKRDSWLPPKDLNNQYTNFYDIEIQSQYQVMIYYAFLLIVGNEMAPKNVYQTILFIFVIIFGALLISFIFGSIAAAMSTMGKQQNRFQDLADLVQSTMIQIKLPEQFQNEIQDYLIKVEESQDVNLDFEMFLKLLSPFLKHNVQNYILNRIVNKNEYLCNAKPLAINFIVKRLKNQMFIPQDEIISQDTEGHYMYFIITGNLEVFLQKQVQLQQMRKINKYHEFIPIQLQSLLTKSRKEQKQINQNFPEMSISYKNSVKKTNLKKESGILSSRLSLLTPENSMQVSPSNSSMKEAAKNSQRFSFRSADQNKMSPLKQMNLSARKLMSMSNLGLNMTVADVKVDQEPDANEHEVINKFEHSYYHDFQVRKLTDGMHFGEIGVLTKMKRTASVRALDYSTVSSFHQDEVQELKMIFPNLVNQFKQGIKEKYMDQDFMFKKAMVRCVPYFSKLSDDIILEIIYLLKSEKFNQDNKIIKRGDNIQRLCFVFEGIVEVTIPFLDKDLFFDNLNPGSNFSVFSCFNEESQSIVNFSAKTSCIINFIEVEDLFTLSKLHIDLKDIIKKIYIEQINLTKTDFDFFRFNPDMMFADKVKKSKSKAYVSKMKLNMAKRQILKAFKKFIIQYRKGEVYLPIAIEAIHYLQLQKQESHNFKWIKNKEQERMTQFIRRTKSINQLSNKEKNMVEKNYQFIMGQIYRDEEFKMLTIPEMEQMEVMFYQHNDPSQEINYEAIFQKNSCDNILDIRKFSSKVQEKLTDKGTSIDIKIKIFMDKITELEFCEGNQDLIDLLSTQVATLWYEKKLIKCRATQKLISLANQTIHCQMKDIQDLRKNSFQTDQIIFNRLKHLKSQYKKLVQNMENRGSSVDSNSFTETSSEEEESVEDKSSVDINLQGYAGIGPTMPFLRTSNPTGTIESSRTNENLKIDQQEESNLKPNTHQIGMDRELQLAAQNSKEQKDQNNQQLPSLKKRKSQQITPSAKKQPQVLRSTANEQGQNEFEKIISKEVSIQNQFNNVIEFEVNPDSDQNAQHAQLLQLINSINKNANTTFLQNQKK